MAFTDKEIICKDCGGPFIFTAGEQEFYAAKGLQNEPARCPRCRTARRTARAAEPEDGYVRYGVFASFGGKTPRQMHPAACAECGVAAGRIAGLTGAWVGERKIGAIGIRISRWITSHGFAFNVGTRLEHFGLIVPCGIADRGVTSLELETGGPLDIESVETSLVRHFADVFDRQLVR